MAAPAQGAFVRDRFTWLGYVMIGLLSYVQAVLGPLMPFLRGELGLNFTEGSYHFSAAAAGGIVVGLVGDRLIARIGRRAGLWGSAFGMVAGMLLLAVGQHLAVTVFGALLSGLCISVLLLAVQAAQSDHHGERRALALTEGNVAASMAAMLGPFLVGTFERIGVFGWRGSLYAIAAALLIIAVFYLRTPIPERPRRADVQERPAGGMLPLAYWAYALVIALGTALEWSTIFWGTDFLESVVGLPAVDAATMMTVFFVAMLIGRIVGSRLTRAFASTRLLIGAQVVSLIGFLLLWLAPIAPLNVAGLFLAGLGIANLFPQGISVALSLAPERANAAVARVGLLVGVAILIAPQVLGQAADAFGLRTAYGLVAAIIVVALGTALAANTLVARRMRGVTRA